MFPDKVLPVKIGVKLCLPENVSVSMINFRQELKAVWDDRTAFEAGNGVMINPLSYCYGFLALNTSMEFC